MAKSTLIHNVATSLSSSLSAALWPYWPSVSDAFAFVICVFSSHLSVLPLCLVFFIHFSVFIQVYVNHLIIFSSCPLILFRFTWFSSIPPSLWLWPSRTKCVFLITSWRARAWLRSASRCRPWWTRPPADAITADHHADGMSHDAATHQTLFHVPAAASTFILLNWNWKTGEYSENNIRSKWMMPLTVQFTYRIQIL